MYGEVGHVQHTVLTPDQITTRILHRWPMKSANGSG